MAVGKKSLPENRLTGGDRKRMATIGTRGNYHTLNYTDPETGKPRRRSICRIGTLTERQLERIRRDKEDEIERYKAGERFGGTFGHRPVPLFGDFVLDDYLPWHKLQYPHSHFRVEQILIDHLLPKFRAVALNRIGPKEVEDYMVQRGFSVKSATVAKELRTLRAVLHRAVNLEIIEKSPIRIVKAPRILDSKPHRWYSKEELEKLYTACSRKVNNGEGPQPDAKRAAIWKLIANTGMRRSEAMALRWMCVSEKSIRIISTEERRTKSGKFRTIPKSVGAAEALEKLKNDSMYVLPRVMKESLSRAFLKDAKAAGVGGSLHVLRHTYICHLLLSGLPARTVQNYSGHAHVTTLERYAYQTLEHAPDEVARLNI
jgi:integrase